MARRIRNANPVTLFPFLAVLMCTIGALVLLLVVISAQIRGSAVQQFVAEQKKNAEPAQPIEPPPPAVEEPVTEPEPVVVEPVVVVVQEPEPVAPPEPPVARTPPPVPASDEQLAAIEELKLQTVALQSKYDDAIKEVDGLSQKRSALDRQLKAVAGQETDLKQSLQRALAVSTIAGKQLASLNVENRQIVELLEQSDELIKSERKRVATPRHSLIPYDGQTGTIRKPIVIECSEGTIRFEAEDVELDVEQLEKYPPGVNPLVAGIQTLFTYWTEKARAAGQSGVSTRPYALLIVRPLGADQFRLARVLLQPLVGDYGYEFVEETFEYDVPATTDEATRKCREAVEAAFRMRPRGPGVGSMKLHAGAGSVGGAGARPGGGVVLPRGPIDVERLTQRPAASRGFFGSGNFRRRLIGDSDRNIVDGDFASTGSDQTSSGGDLRSRSEVGNPQDAASQSRPQGEPSTERRDAGDVDQTDGTGRAGTSSEGGSSRVPGRPQPETAGGSPTTARRGATGSQSSSQRQNASKATLEPGLRDDTPDARREAGSAVAEFLAKARAIRERQQQGSGSAGDSADSNSGTTGDKSTTAPSSTAEKSNGASGNSSGGGAAASGPSSPSLSRTIDRSKRRGDVQKRWGQSDPNATLGLERPVTMVIGQSRVLIVGAYQITLRPEWSELQSVNICLKGLEMTANDWGKPSERFYWVPVVTLRVENGGESLARLLEASLDRLGVVVEHEPTFFESGRGD